MIKSKIKLSNSKGITLIAMMLLVVVLLVVGGILLGNTKTETQVANLKTMQTDIKALDEKVNAYYAQNEVLPILKEYSGSTDFLWEFDELGNRTNYLGNPNDIGKETGVYYIIDIEELNNISLSLGTDFAKIKTDSSEELTDIYIIDEQSHQIYYPKQVKIDDGETNSEYFGYDGDAIDVGKPSEQDKVGPKFYFSPDGTAIYKQSVTVAIKSNDTDIKGNRIHYIWTQEESARFVKSNFESSASIERNGTVSLDSLNGEGTYYLWAMAEDYSGNSTIKRSKAYYIDSTSVGFDTDNTYVIESGEGIFSEGETITVSVNFTEKIKGAGSGLKIQFGDGAERTIISKNSYNAAMVKKAVFEIKVQAGDNGILKINGITEGFTDEAGNPIAVDELPQRDFEKVEADTTKPTISFDSAISGNTIANGIYSNYINKADHELKVFIKSYDINYKQMRDVAQNESSILVNGNPVSSITEATQIENTGTEGKILISVKDVNENGELAVVIPSGLVEDKATQISNKNDQIIITPTINGEKIIVDNTAPTIEAATIYSSNDNEAYVKNGERVSVYLKFSEPIAELPLVTIGGRNAIYQNETVGSEEYTCYIDIPNTESSLAEGKLDIVIGEFKDRAENNGAGRDTTTNGSTVIYDRTKPSITLNQIKNESFILPNGENSQYINKDGLMYSNFTITDVNLEDEVKLNTQDIVIRVDGNEINQNTNKYFEGNKQEQEVESQEAISFLAQGITGDGVITLKFANALIKDKAGNVSDEVVLEKGADGKNLTADNIQPALTISANVTLVNNYTNAENITYKIEFTEPIVYSDENGTRDITKDDFEVENCKKLELNKISDTIYELKVNNTDYCDDTIEEIEQKLKVGKNLKDRANNNCVENELILKVDRKAPEVIEITDQDKKVLQLGTTENKVTVTVKLNEEVQLDFQKLATYSDVVAGEPESSEYKKEWKLGIEVDTSKIIEEGEEYTIRIPAEIFKDKAGNKNKVIQEKTIKIIIAKYVITTANELEELMHIVNLRTQSKYYSNITHTGSENDMYTRSSGYTASTYLMNKLDWTNNQTFKGNYYSTGPTTFKNETIYLGGDIDLTNCVLLNGTTGKVSISIGNYYMGKYHDYYGPFEGTFNGLGYTIKINQTSSLFRWVGPTSVIKNLTLEGSMSGSSDYMAPFVYEFGNEEHETSYSYRGERTGGTIENCINKVVVNTSGDYAAGFVAEAYGGTFRNCENQANITGGDYAAGFVAYKYISPGDCDDSTDFIGCTNTGNITGNAGSRYGGGAAGFIAYMCTINSTAYRVTNEVYIDECINKGKISGKYAAGIAIGKINNWNNPIYVYVYDSKNEGEITGTYAATGGAMYAKTTISRMINTGNVTATSGDASGATSYYGSARSCENSGKIVAYGGMAAGIAVDASSARSCTNTGDIIGISAAGIINTSWGGTYSDDYKASENINRGNVIGGEYAAGIAGIYGSDTFNISYSYNTGRVQAGTIDDEEVDESLKAKIQTAANTIYLEGRRNEYSGGKAAGICWSYGASTDNDGLDVRHIWNCYNIGKITGVKGSDGIIIVDGNLGSRGYTVEDTFMLNDGVSGYSGNTYKWSIIKLTEDEFKKDWMVMGTENGDPSIGKKVSTNRNFRTKQYAWSTYGEEWLTYEFMQANNLNGRENLYDIFNGAGVPADAIKKVGRLNYQITNTNVSNYDTEMSTVINTFSYTNPGNVRGQYSSGKKEVLISFYTEQDVRFYKDTEDGGYINGGYPVLGREIGIASASSAAAQIKEKNLNYTTLRQAINDADPGNTIIIMNDNVVSKPEGSAETDTGAIIVNKDLIIDLNGHKVSSDEEIDTLIKNSANLTIIGSGSLGAQQYGIHNTTTGTVTLKEKGVTKNISQADLVAIDEENGKYELQGYSSINTVKVEEIITKEEVTKDDGTTEMIVTNVELKETTNLTYNTNEQNVLVIYDSTNSIYSISAMNATFELDENGMLVNTNDTSEYLRAKIVEGPNILGINNEGTVIIGTQDGIVNHEAPSISATTQNTGTIKFYDGTMSGVNRAIRGNTEVETESDYTIYSTTISGTYENEKTTVTYIKYVEDNSYVLDSNGNKVTSESIQEEKVKVNKEVTTLNGLELVEDEGTLMLIDKKIVELKDEEGNVVRDENGNPETTEEKITYFIEKTEETIEGSDATVTYYKYIENNDYVVDSNGNKLTSADIKTETREVEETIQKLNGLVIETDENGNLYLVDGENKTLIALVEEIVEVYQSIVTLNLVEAGQPIIEKVKTIYETNLNTCAVNMSFKDETGILGYTVELRESTSPEYEIIGKKEVEKEWVDNGTKEGVWEYKKQETMDGSLTITELDSNKDYKLRVTVTDIFQNTSVKECTLGKMATYEPNEGEYVIDVNNTTVEVTAKLTMQNKSNEGIRNVEYGWSKTNTIKPTTWGSSSETIIDITQNLTGGANYLWVKIIDKEGNETIQVSENFKCDYRITYDANGGYGELGEDQLKVYNETLTLSSLVPKKDVRIFKGWSTNPDSIEAEYQSGAEYKVNSSATLYAVWEKVQGLDIGDYVEYTPEGHRAYNNIIARDNDLKWRVLDVKDGKIRLISDRPTAQTYEVTGYEGYNNFVYLLNDMCNYMYGSSLGTGASLNVEDIQSKMDLNVWDYKTATGYGVSTQLSGNYYPNILAQEKDITIDGKTGTVGSSEQQELLTGQAYTQKNSSVNIEMIANCWNKTFYTAQTVDGVTSNTGDYFNDSRYYELFINSNVQNPTHYSYWYSNYFLASRMRSGTYFYVPYITQGKLTNTYLAYTSSNNISSSATFALRPVITLNIDVEINKNSGDGTIENPWKIKVEEKQESKVKVGDYVYYKPLGNDQYNIEAKYSGFTSDQTIAKDTADDFKWRVLDVENGIIRLISSRPTTSTVSFTGYQGYNNAVYLLDDMCKMMYSSDMGTAKSLKIEDIQSKLDLDIWNYKKSSYYGTSASYSSRNYPKIFAEEINGNVNGEKGSLAGSEQLELKEQTGNLTANITPMFTHWAIYFNGSTTISNIKFQYGDYFKNPKYYELYQNNGNGDYAIYYLSSRQIEYDSYKNYVRFDIAYVGGMVGGLPLYISNNSLNKYECAVRPVVTLNANIIIDETSGNGTESNPWKLVREGNTYEASVYKNGETKYYETLNEAITNCTSGQTITVLKNITLSEPLELSGNKNITLDLNGQKINSLSTPIMNIVSNCSLELNGDNGEMNTESSSAIVNEGKLTLSNIKIKSNSNYGITNTGTFEMYSNTTINGASGIWNNGGKVDIYGGVINNDTGKAIEISSGEVTIDAGTFKGKTDTIYVDGENTKLTVNGGKIGKYGSNYCSNAGIAITNSNVTILDGTVYGIYCETGTLTLGENNEGEPGYTTPKIYQKQDEACAISLGDTATFNFYDGVIKGNSKAINGTVANVPVDCEVRLSTSSSGLETATLFYSVPFSKVSKITFENATTMNYGYKVNYDAYKSNGTLVFNNQPWGSSSVTKIIGLHTVKLSFYDSNGNQITRVRGDQKFEINYNSTSRFNYLTKNQSMPGSWVALYADSTPIEYIEYNGSISSKSFESPEVFSNLYLHSYIAYKSSYTLQNYITLSNENIANITTNTIDINKSSTGTSTAYNTIVNAALEIWNEIND